MNVKTFTLQEHHIRNGISCNSSGCPIALCIMEELGLNVGEVEVSKYYITINDKTYQTPGDVGHFIEDFDFGNTSGTTEGLTFSIDLDSTEFTEDSLDGDDFYQDDLDEEEFLHDEEDF